MKKISIVIPSFNEEGNISEIYKQISHEILKMNFEIIFINDGSTDNTLKNIKMLSMQDARVKYISFSRNFGHQNALKAGLDMATGDCVISMDADLQHPVHLLPQMIDLWNSGYDLVYTVRKDIENVGMLKRITALLFYKFINLMVDVKIPQGTADFRLVDKRLISILREQFNETNMFYRGVFPWLGFKQTAIEYVPQKRFSGQTKYKLKNMINFAIVGITSFSIKPLRMAIFLGLLTTGFAMLYLFYILVLFLFTDKALQGWSSLIASVLVMGGINMLLLGVIGEYIGKIALQVKNRPEYIINETNIKHG